MTRLAAWYRHPDQELLRREMMWSIRWLTRGAGALWIVVYLLAHAVIVAAAIVMDMVQGVIFFAMLLTPLTWINFALRQQIIRNRTLGLFRPGVHGQLWISRLSQRDLWPGLLCSPAVFTLALAAIEAAFALTMMGWMAWQLGMTAESWGFMRNVPAPGAAPAGPSGPFSILMGGGAGFPEFGLAYYAAIFGSYLLQPFPRIAGIMFVAWRCYPRRAGYPEIVGWQLLFILLCSVPGLVVWLGWFALHFEELFLGAVQKQPLQPGIGLTLALNGLYIATIIALGIVSWSQLRRPAAWERLRMEAEFRPH